MSLSCAEEAEVEVPDPGLWRQGISSRGAGNPELLEKTLEYLLGTDKPCVIAGHGAVLSEAAPELRKLVELLNPVYSERQRSSRRPS
jgi:thiamine pyrophosphate-dependent acetolactate synthase large subunit-like protein